MLLMERLSHHEKLNNKDYKTSSQYQTIQIVGTSIQCFVQIYLYTLVMNSKIKIEASQSK